MTVWRHISVLLVALSVWRCDNDEGPIYARRITSAHELIGGPKAIGQVGDWLIGNSQFRVVIQDQGWSRGFGIFGGGVIDVDLQRPGVHSSAAGGTGNDYFGELFPALFLEAWDVDKQFEVGKKASDRIELAAIEVLKDGSDGREAIIRTRASGGDFLTTVGELNDVALPPAGLRFETDFIVRPGTRHLEVIARIKNVVPGASLDLSASGLLSLLQTFGAAGISQIQLPVGDVALFGGGNKVFVPGAVCQAQQIAGNPPVCNVNQPAKPVGFDIRYSVEASQKFSQQLPALPGLIADFVAATAPGVSYGLAMADSERNFVALNATDYARDQQAQISKHALLLPFIIDAFTGVYYAVPPSSLAPAGEPGDIFEFKKYLVVGHGDVGSVRDELYRIRNVDTGEFSGTIVNGLTGAAESEASVLLFDRDKRPFSQVQTDENGNFRCDLEPGNYFFRVLAPGRYPFPKANSPDAEKVFFEMPAGKNVYRRIELPAPAELVVQAFDEAGRRVPAKVTVVSTYGSEHDGQDPKEFLFDLSLGEARRPTDLSHTLPPPDRTRQYIETQFLLEGGVGSVPVRPSPCVNGRCATYDIYVTRGPEYAAHVERQRELREGERYQISAKLVRTVDTENYVGADLHVHSRNSVDAYAQVRDRVTNAAAEGIEVLVATDHNYITDYQPEIQSLGLQDWLTSVVGTELSTLEMGHFGAFPLNVDAGSATHLPLVKMCFNKDASKVNGTAFDWVQCEPQEIFDNLRSLGRFGRETIIQINHPRDAILGYFNEYFLNPYVPTPETPNALNYPAAGLFLTPHNSETQQFEPSRFSWDFDAIEILTGKRLDQLHAFTLPVSATDNEVLESRDFLCANGHPFNGRGKVLLREGGYPAYPGAVDDWLNMLNMGRVYTATGNSDSHEMESEIGYPRTYLYVEPKDDQRQDRTMNHVSDLDVVAAIRSHRATVSNGAFLDMRVRTANAADLQGGPVYWNIGETVRYDRSNINQRVVLEIVLQSPPWAKVEEIRLYANGVVIKRIAVPQGQDPLTGRDVDDNNVFVIDDLSFVRDTVLVAEAVGEQNLFPYVIPREDPPANISSALGALVESFGAGATFATADGIHAPNPIQVVKPYALTNPIWLDIDADGSFVPPGIAGAFPGPAPIGSCPVATMRTPLPAEKLFFTPPAQARRYQRWDIRKVLDGHAIH